MNNGKRRKERLLRAHAGMPTRTEVTVNDGDEQDEQDTPAPRRSRRDPGDTRTPVDVHIQRHRSARRAVRFLDEQVETLTDELKELRKSAGKAPKGGLVLDADAATRFAAYEKLGVPADRLATIVQEHGTFKARVQEVDAAGLAKAAGFKPLVTKLARSDGGRLEARDVTETVDGKRVTNSVLHIVFGEGDGEKATPVTEYAERHWKDDLADIKLPVENKSPTRTTGRNGSNVTGDAKSSDGPRGGEHTRSYHAQAASGEAADTDEVANYLQSVRIRPGQQKQQA